MKAEPNNDKNNWYLLLVKHYLQDRIRACRSKPLVPGSAGEQRQSLTPLRSPSFNHRAFHPACLSTSPLTWLTGPGPSRTPDACWATSEFNIWVGFPLPNGTPRPLSFHVPWPGPDIGASGSLQTQIEPPLLHSLDRLVGGENASSSQMPEFLGSQGSESIPKEKLPLSWKLPVWPHPWHLCNTHCCSPSGQKRGMPVCHRSSWGLGGHEAGALHSRPASRLCDPGQEGTGNIEGALEMSVHLSPTLLLREMQPRPPVSATSRKSGARSRGKKGTKASQS